MINNTTKNGYFLEIPVHFQPTAESGISIEKEER